MVTVDRGEGVGTRGAQREHACQHFKFKIQIHCDLTTVVTYKYGITL